MSNFISFGIVFDKSNIDINNEINNIESLLSRNANKTLLEYPIAETFEKWEKFETDHNYSFVLDKLFKKKKRLLSANIKFMARL